MTQYFLRYATASRFQDWRKVLENHDDGKAKYSDLGTRVKARYRYEVTGCTSPKNEDSFSAIIRPLPIDPIVLPQTRHV